MNAFFNSSFKVSCFLVLTDVYECGTVLMLVCVQVREGPASDLSANQSVGRACPQRRVLWYNHASAVLLRCEETHHRPIHHWTETKVRLTGVCTHMHFVDDFDF